jgi:GGDEF domain-containing protein
MFEEYSTKVSTGWALSESEKSYEDVLAIADRALYQSKKARVSNS